MVTPIGVELIDDIRLTIHNDPEGVTVQSRKWYRAKFASDRWSKLTPEVLALEAGEVQVYPERGRPQTLLLDDLKSSGRGADRMYHGTNDGLRYDLALRAPDGWMIQQISADGPVQNELKELQPGRSRSRRQQRTTEPGSATPAAMPDTKEREKTKILTKIDWIILGVFGFFGLSYSINGGIQQFFIGLLIASVVLIGYAGYCARKASKAEDNPEIDRGFKRVFVSRFAYIVDCGFDYDRLTGLWA